VETAEVDFDEGGGELTAAVWYLAALAYPEPRSTSGNRRDRTVRAMLAWLNRGAEYLGKPTASFARQLFDEFPSWQVLGNALGRGQKGALARIRLRLRAAKAAEQLFATSMLDLSRTEWTISIRVENLQHDFVGRVLWDGPLTLNDIAKREGSNFKHFVWAVSKPVVHLAFALLRMRINDDGRPFWMQLLAKPEWTRDALPLAELWRSRLVAAIPELDVADVVRVVERHKDSQTTLP
jgi:hypothetical protein